MLLQVDIAGVTLAGVAQGLSHSISVHRPWERSDRWGAFPHPPAGRVVWASARMVCRRLCLASQVWHFAREGVEGPLGPSPPIVSQPGPLPDVTHPSTSGELAVRGCVMVLLGPWFSSFRLEEVLHVSWALVGTRARSLSWGCRAQSWVSCFPDVNH